MELSVVAAAKPQPYGCVAFAYYLESLPASSKSSVRVSFVPSLESSKAKDVVLQANGCVSWPLSG